MKDAHLYLNTSFYFARATLTNLDSVRYSKDEEKPFFLMRFLWTYISYKDS